MNDLARESNFATGEIRPHRTVRIVASFLMLAANMPAGQTDVGTSGHLKGLSLEQLADIEVTTASRKPVKLTRTPAAVFVITQDDIRRSGATSIPEALRLAPGVQVARIDSVKWSIGIRGFGSRLSRSVLVVIDGRNVYSPLHAGVYWEVQDTLMEDVERIEIIRGPGATIWGTNAVNGVINIITRNSKDTRGDLVSLGGGNKQRFVNFRHGGSRGEKLNYRLYGKTFSRGPEFHPDGRNFDDWHMGQGGFRMDWDLKDLDTLMVQGNLYKGSIGERVAVATDPLKPPAIVERDGRLSGANLLGRWQHALKDGSQLEVQTYYDRTQRSEPNLKETRDTFDVDVLHQKTLARKHALLWGAGVRLSAGRVPTVLPTLLFTPENRTDKLYSAFVQDEVELLESELWLTLGSKFVHTDFSGFGAQPSVRLLWNQTPRQSWWTSVTRALRTPSDVEETLTATALVSTSPLAIARLAPDGKFVPESVLGYEAGYRRVFGRQLNADVAAFHNRYTNLLSAEIGTPFLEASPAPARIVVPLVPANGLYGSTSGFEVGLDWRPASWWRLDGSYAHLRMDLNARPESRDTTTVGSAEGSAPHHQVILQSSLDLPGRLEFSQTYRYVSDLPAQLVAAYGTADVRLSWRRLEHFELSVTGQNLLQPHHAEYGGNPGTLVGIKRSIFGAITWSR